jgi:hypothetical protein
VVISATRDSKVATHQLEYSFCNHFALILQFPNAFKLVPVIFDSFDIGNWNSDTTLESYSDLIARLVQSQ